MLGSVAPRLNFDQASKTLVLVAGICRKQQCPIGLLRDQKHQELAHLFDKPCFLESLAVQAPQVPNQQINVMVEESTMAISRHTLFR
ncbi:hypothetical protein SUGI_0649840 [Cryptomeria japonica]|nr:hypothetical protein SUGI_0649840 [Cryptomeria japonica]